MIRKKLEALRQWHTNPHNSEIRNCEISSLPIYGVYHIFAYNDWYDICCDQLQRLKNSGLYDATNKFFLSIIADDNSTLDSIKSLFANSDYEIISYTDKKEAFEFPAIEYIRNRADEEEFFCYYFHTKGSSQTEKTIHEYKRQGITKLSFLKKSSVAWRKAMEYWIFDNYDLALKSLSNGHGAYGSMVYDVDDSLRFFGGNFWWASSTFLKTRTKFSEEDKKNRYKAENWLLLGEGVRYYCPFFLRGAKASNIIPEGIYDKTKMSIIENTFFYIKYLKIRILGVIKRAIH